MTRRRHADEEHLIPRLKASTSDVNSAESDPVSELLEGYLGPDAGDREDVPSLDQQQDDSDDHVDSLGDATVGQLVCRFCETERRKPSGLAVHHATCPDSQFNREHHRQTADTAESGPSEAVEETDEQDDTSTAAGGDSPGEQRTYLIDTR